VVRLLALAVLALLIYLILRAVIAGFLAGLRGSPRAGAPRAFRNDLVKDPVCETYVPRRSAIARNTGVATYYFCSSACAEKFRAPS
jgi:YHS domain-containing protein